MFLIFDVETNDMPQFKLPADDPKQARIIQIGAILTDANFVTMAEISRIVKPDGTWVIAPGAFGAHGISFERCQDEGVPIASIIDEFDGFADHIAREDGTMVAFNIRFDNKLVRGERRRLQREDRFGLVREFDAMKAASPLCKMPPTPAMIRAGRSNQFKTPKLAEAHKILTGEDMPGAHDALSDCKGTLAILRCLKEKHGIDVRGEKPESYVPAEQRAAAPAAAPTIPTKDDLDSIF